MLKRANKSVVPEIYRHLTRIKAAYQAVPKSGLSVEQVSKREATGQINVCKNPNSTSVGAIIWRNVFNVFNIVNFLLAFFILWAASYDIAYLKNGLFMGVVLSNLLIALSQELKAKRILDKLSILLNLNVTVIRDGKAKEISSDKLLVNDIFQVKSGLQLPVDGIVVESQGLTVDESLLTGESVAVTKQAHDYIFAGSNCTGGAALVQACLVGKDSFANQITLQAKKAKGEKSELRLGLSRLIAILASLILPLGLILFYKNYLQNIDLAKNLVLTVATVIGMIPEGLILLSEVAFAVATMKLAKADCLVQHVSAVEMLARTDVLCLDKTGTITTGAMQLIELVPLEIPQQLAIFDLAALTKYLLISNDSDNQTAKALLKAWSKIDCRQVEAKLGQAIMKQPFNSARKYQALKFALGTFYIGATEFIYLNQAIPASLTQKISTYSQAAYRVLLVAYKPNATSEIVPLALLSLTDEIRQTAKQTFDYFRKQGVDIKIISGDNPETLSAISKQAGLVENAKYIDLSKLSKVADYTKLVNEYQLFGRVSPAQKECLVEALQATGHVVTMTGDGVNDVPALKKADCAVAMRSGSDACRKSADLVLLNNDFAVLIQAVYEGRRVINNIKLVASLFLNKTIYASLMAVFYLFSRKLYPLYPIQLTLLSTLTIGIPGFCLTLKANKERLTGHFWRDVLSSAGLTATVSLILLVSAELLLTGNAFYIKWRQIYILLSLAAPAFALLVYKAQPLDKLKLGLAITLGLAFSLAIIYLPNLFSLPVLNLFDIMYCGLWFSLVYLLTRFVLKLMPIFTKYLS